MFHSDILNWEFLWFFFIYSVIHNDCIFCTNFLHFSWHLSLHFVAFSVFSPAFILFLCHCFQLHFLSWSVFKIDEQRSWSRNTRFELIITFYLKHCSYCRQTRGNTNSINCDEGKCFMLDDEGDLTTYTYSFKQNQDATLESNRLNIWLNKLSLWLLLTLNLWIKIKYNMQWKNSF